VLGLFGIIALSLIFYTMMTRALIQRTLDQFSSINILTKDLVGDIAIPAFSDVLNGSI